MKLDRIDINILVALQENGRVSNVNLAEAVGLSPSPCLQRVKRLEQAGYISSYNASLDLGRLAETVTVFTEIFLHDHRLSDFTRFERAVGRVDEVMECHLISGGYDYLLRFLCRSIRHYQEVIESLISQDLGIEKYFSYIVIKSPLQRGAVPLRNLLQE
ncbi:Lrp/AsnC family transcriptional regulator [Marinobacterium lutimaris]|uniref:DNA-binding transcriptional regulator, Lrp family n=1 Tax=Marinobacterium lutimaris TaxID=568106 RepID=A0A1H6DQI2_9GAMM|nr:Lrp/AsnC family transcriptional regulator [Marinobacterium lutimaris]SEG86973.1 DNA-binding transcriptional regulator, Lrp family [Marinobacterium lutimaris]